MDYFYAYAKDIHSGTLILRNDESKHVARVLRKAIGEHIFVTDGNDRMYDVVIEKITKAETQCRIAAIHTKYHELPFDITLAVSILKNPGRFDLILEKATELGVRRIIPLICSRTVSHRSNHARMEHIVLAAMKQCGRSWLPEISEPTPLSALIKNAKLYELPIMPHEQADSKITVASMASLRSSARSILVAIGPEGGFAEEEIQESVLAGFIPVSLGSRRLRSETAAIVALSQLNVVLT